MQLTLPDGVEAKLSPMGAALHLAIGLFVTEEATLGQAAEIAGHMYRNLYDHNFFLAGPVPAPATAAAR